MIAAVVARVAAATFIRVRVCVMEKMNTGGKEKGRDSHFRFKSVSKMSQIVTPLPKLNIKVLKRQLTPLKLLKC